MFGTMAYGSTTRFRDRREAGRRLAEQLAAYAGRDDVIVLALPRGGVPVAFEVARAIGAPMDVFVVRKIGVPWHEELAMGAIASGGARVLDPDIIESCGVSREEVEAITATEAAELRRREEQYRGTRPFPSLAGKTVLLVDDGLATGSSMRVAATAVRAKAPARIVIAVPVAPRDTCEALREVADDTVCAMIPEPFQAVGLWYQDFSQTSDEEVRALLAEARPPR